MLPAVPLHIDPWLALLLKLAAGIQSIEADYAPVAIERATAYAIAAHYHAVRSGLDPFELIGIARNESDFIPRQRGPDGKDCGLTQTRITNSRFSCRQLQHSAWLAFQEAARELVEYRSACRKAPDFDRCRINRYNSGVRYARRGVAGGYYLRVLCFAQAARSRAVTGDACRRVRGRRDIARIAWRSDPLASGATGRQ